MNSSLWTAPVDNPVVRVVRPGPHGVDQDPGPGIYQRKHVPLVRLVQGVDQESPVQTPSDLHGPPGPPLRGVCVRPRRARARARADHERPERSCR